MAIKLVLRKKEFLIEEKSIQVKQALQQLDLSSEAHLLVRDGNLLTENDWLRDGEEIKIVPVISGGSLNPQQPGSERQRRKRTAS